MPYIVTTKRPVDAVDCGHPEAPRNGWPVSRRAVATLEESIRAVADAQTMAVGFTTGVTLPESGGTVGPLPDGTVIEVERVGWFDVAERVRGKRLVPAGRAAQAELLDAFNAREHEQDRCAERSTT
jgi:hypothetical protein